MLKELFRGRRASQAKAVTLFGAAEAPPDEQLAPLGAYESSLTEQAEADTGFVQLISDDSPAVPLRTPLTLLDFVTPFCHFLSVLLAGKLLTLLAAVIPSLLPSPEAVGWVAKNVSIISLFYGFFRVFFRDSAGRFTRHLRQGSRVGSLGRRVLRRFGRRGWLLWYLALPFWILMLCGAGTVALLGVVALLRALYNSLPAPAPAPAPARPGGPLFGGDEPAFGRALRSMFRAFKFVMLFAGFVFIAAGILNCWTQRPYLNKFFAGFMALMLGVFLSLADGSSHYHPDDAAPPLLPLGE